MLYGDYEMASSLDSFLHLAYIKASRIGLPKPATVRGFGTLKMTRAGIGPTDSPGIKDTQIQKFTKGRFEMGKDLLEPVAVCEFVKRIVFGNIVKGHSSMDDEGGYGLLDVRDITIDGSHHISFQGPLVFIVIENKHDDEWKEGDADRPDNRIFPKPGIVEKPHIGIFRGKGLIPELRFYPIYQRHWNLFPSLYGRPHAWFWPVHPRPPASPDRQRPPCPGRPVHPLWSPVRSRRSLPHRGAPP